MRPVGTSSFSTVASVPSSPPQGGGRTKYIVKCPVVSSVVSASVPRSSTFVPVVVLSAWDETGSPDVDIHS